jgi:hypothetical protein
MAVAHGNFDAGASLLNDQAASVEAENLEIVGDHPESGD